MLLRKYIRLFHIFKRENIKLFKLKMDNTFYGFIPIIIYYVGGLIAYAYIICYWKKRDEAYTYINNTTRLEDL